MFMKHFAGPAFMKHCIRVSFLLLCFYAVGQEIPIGTWRTHYSYNNARVLESTEDKLFCAVENGLFSFDLREQAIRKLSKLDGLSGAGVSALHYSSQNNVLVIGYSSGLIDLIYEDRIETLRDVADSDLEVEKRINAIAAADGSAYVGTSLGVIVIRLDAGRITENFAQIGSGGSQVEVNEVVVLGEEIFVRTNEGIQSGNLSQNLLDFNNWTMYPSTEGIRELTLVDDNAYGIEGSLLYQFEQGFGKRQVLCSPME